MGSGFDFVVSTRNLKILNALGLVISIAVGAGLFYYFISTPPAQKKKQPPELLPTAEVITLKAQSYDAVIHGYGTVRPSERLDVLSEIPGMVVEMGPNAAEGNLIEKDALLFRIDDSSIVAEIEQLTAQIASIDAQRAEVKVQQENDIRLLEIEKQVFELAKKDHERLINIYEKGLSPSSRSRPQRLAATNDSSPWRNAGRPLPRRIKDWLHSKPTARLLLRCSRPKGFSSQRSVTAIIELPGPYERKMGKTGRGLLPGTFVRVAIHGRRYENILVVPAKAMNTDNSLYLVQNGKLRNVVVEPIVVLGTDAILPVTPAMPSGSKVVLNDMPGAFEGSPVRIWEKEADTS